MLDEIPGRRKSMAQAVDIFRGLQRHDNAHPLELMCDELAQNHAAYKFVSWKNDAVIESAKASITIAPDINRDPRTEDTRDA